MYKSTISQSVIFQSSLMSLQLRKHLPKDHKQMMIKVKDKCIIMNYGTNKMKNIVPIHGEELQMIPEECVSMHPFQKTVLHMEHDCVKSPEWPCIALSKTSTTVVVHAGFDNDHSKRVHRCFTMR
jgi:hypothetical protein